MVEGDLWVYARTDLADFYAGRLTLRQIFVRFSGLPAEANIWAETRAELERAESLAKASEVDAALNMFGGQHG